MLFNKYRFLTGSSTPDEAKTAKLILKDYVAGNLLFNHIRPDYNKDLHGRVWNYKIYDAEGDYNLVNIIN